MTEGSIWEVFAHAAWEGLDNLTPIVDVNRLGQARSGWHAVIVDAIDRAFTEVAAATGEPTVLLARAAKVRGVKVVEDQPGKLRSAVPICARLAAP